MYAVDFSSIPPEQEDLRLQKHFKLINLDELFASSPDAKIINNETLVSQKLSKEFTDAIYCNSDGELGFVPTCQCGYTRGLLREGLICPKCDTICSNQFTDHLTHISWVSMPETFPPVLHPIWYMILKTWTSIGRRDISVVDIILNPELAIPDDLAPYIEGRGFQYFYENADAILDMMLDKYPKTAKKAAVNDVKIFRSKYRDVMFTRKLPILHNSLHPLKCNGGTLNFADSTSKEILSVVIDLSTETFKQHATTVSFKQMNKSLFDIYTKVITYYKSLLDKKLGGKQAMLRKHCFGSRVHYSFRSVVTPHVVALPMDEILLPWSMLVTCLKQPILNLLLNRQHYNLSKALTTYRRALRIYSDEIRDVLKTIIYEYDDHRLPVGLGRNPEYINLGA